MKRLVRYCLLFILLIALLLCGVGVYLFSKDYSSAFRERRGTLATARRAPANGDSLSQKSWLTIANAEGFTVECGVLAPRDSLRRYPAIVVLGGKTTGKHAIDYALGIENVVIIAVDYPFEPRARYSLIQFLADVPTIRQALLDMAPSVMLVVDYLHARRDVDTAKIILLGYSFGAPLVPCIVSNERRFAAAAMVYGAGNLRTLIRHNVNRYEGKWMSEFVGALGAVLLAPLEPMRSIERIAPIPFIMINGTNDEMIPRDNVEALYAHAQAPKRIVWLESAHVNPRNPELTKRIILTLQRELAALGALPDP